MTPKIQGGGGIPQNNENFLFLSAAQTGVSGELLGAEIHRLIADKGGA